MMREISPIKWLLNRTKEDDTSSLIGADETVLLKTLREQNAARQGYNKIFCIGYNKTGTSSMEWVLRDLGFRLPDQPMQEKQTSHVLVSGRYDALRDLVEEYDAFQDVPFSQERIYVALDAMFPRSKFILTVRDPEAWYESLLGYHRKVFGFSSLQELSPDYWKGSRYLHRNYTFEQQRRLVTKVVDGQIFEDWEMQYDRQERINEFSARNNEIIRYFRDRPSDLLCVDLSKEYDTSKICVFLNVNPKYSKEIPRLNARDS